MKRSILAVLAGLVSAMVTFVMAEKVNTTLHPFPVDLNFQNTEVVGDYLAGQPTLYWMMIILGWILGSLLCGVLIKYIKKTEQKKLPVIAGAVLTLSAVANFMLLPHHTWFVIVGLCIFIPATLIGHSLYKLN